MPFSFFDWWMLTGKMLWQASNSSRPTTPCRSWSSHTLTPSLRFKLNLPWPIGCPLARLYADSPLHVPKGAQRHGGTLWIMSAGHLVITLMHVLFPYHMMSHERSENNSIFHKGTQTDFLFIPPNDSPRQQPWQAPVISSAMAFQSIS